MFHVSDFTNDEGSSEYDQQSHHTHHRETDHPEHQRYLMSTISYTINLLHSAGLYLHHNSTIIHLTSGSDSIFSLLLHHIILIIAIIIIITDHSHLCLITDLNVLISHVGHNTIIFARVSLL